MYSHNSYTAIYFKTISDVTEKSARSKHCRKPENKRQKLKENVGKQSQRKNSQAKSRKNHTKPQVSHYLFTITPPKKNEYIFKTS
jgi:hypothetical protein